MPVIIYAGDSDKGEIFSLEGATPVKCTDPHFSDFICVQKDDFNTILLHK